MQVVLRFVVNVTGIVMAKNHQCFSLKFIEAKGCNWFDSENHC